MDEERFKSIRRTERSGLRVTAQREVERAVQAALESGKLTGREVLQARIDMKLEGLPTDIAVEGQIELA